MLVSVPEQLGPYRLLDVLGEGGMGVVHLAARGDGNPVALKVLRPHLLGGVDARDRLAREVAAMRRVRGRHVAEVLDADVAGPTPYIVTRYVPGPPLDSVVRDHGPLRGDALRRLVTGLLEALDTVHAAGVVHRDIKPGNVMLHNGEPVLIDFGLARALDDARLTATGLVVGTPGYLAPETVMGLDPTPATDVHGVAATIAFAATGQSPYGKGPDVVVLDRIRRGEISIDGVTETLRALLAAGLAVEPSERPSIAEFRQRLGLAPAAAPTLAGSGAKQPVTSQTVMVAGQVTAVVGAPDATIVVGPAPATAMVGRVTPPTRIDLPPGGVAWASPSAAPAAAHVPFPHAAARPLVPATPPPPSLQQPLPPATDAAGSVLRTRAAQLGLLAAIAMLTPLLPNFALITVFLLLVVGRTLWLAGHALWERRRIRGGPHSSDVVVGVLSSPWHAFRALVGAVLQLVPIFLVAATAGAVAHGAGADARGTLTVAGIAGALMGWSGPGAKRPRAVGTWAIIRLTRDRRAGWVLPAALFALAWMLGMAYESYGTNWWPGQPPDWLVGVPGFS